MGFTYYLYAPQKHVAISVAGLTVSTPEHEFMSSVFDGFSLWSIERPVSDGRKPELRVTDTTISIKTVIAHFLIFSRPGPVFFVPEYTIERISDDFVAAGRTPITTIFELQELLDLVVDPEPNGYDEFETSYELIKRYLDI